MMWQSSHLDFSHLIVPNSHVLQYANDTLILSCSPTHHRKILENFVFVNDLAINYHKNNFHPPMFSCHGKHPRHIHGFCCQTYLGPPLSPPWKTTFCHLLQLSLRVTTNSVVLLNKVHKVVLPISVMYSLPILVLCHASFSVKAIYQNMRKKPLFPLGNLRYMHGYTMSHQLWHALRFGKSWCFIGAKNLGIPNVCF
jgi:hypothetical protein